ncbi:MAG: hypothetical protein VW665_03935 [Candidatus Puniceispirillum sp.]|jgi:hypothetical protein
MKNVKSKMKLALTMLLVPAALSACQPLTLSESSAAVDYRYERFQDMQLKADYDACRKTAFTLDKGAGADSSRLLASAEKFESCELMLGKSGKVIDRDMRLKAIAMGVQNYIKGGNLTKARTMLDQFEHVADGADLLYPDSTSFVASMRVLLNADADKSALRLASMNAKSALKDEIRRAWYWQAN